MIEWVSVDEQLPRCIEKFGMSKVVLACDFRGNVGFAIYQDGTGQLGNRKGWFTGGGVGEESVMITHWSEINRPEKN